MCSTWRTAAGQRCAAPGGLLQVSEGTDENRVNDLLTFILNAIFRAASKYFGIESKLIIKCARVE